MKPPKIGAQYLGDRRCTFTVWAPLKDTVAVHLLPLDDGTDDRLIPLDRGDMGYWQATVEAVEAGTLYYVQFDGEDSPDPASHFQPEGVHGPSQIVDHHQFAWGDHPWEGLKLSEAVIYELHVATFTPEGTFEAIITRLPELLDLGITAIELMPIAQFPGDQSKAGCAYRNWGYDGTFPFATQNSYGGVQGLKTLVDACHQQGMAVLLDVVYNHLGPEGNYLWHLGTYFTDKYKTPWGSAVNYDDAYSDGVREYFVQNVLYWLETCHLDGLRLDAVHAIYDFGAKHILQEMGEAASKLSGFPRYLIAESDLNDPRLVRPTSLGGYGLDGQWSDDFHHALHTAVTGENHGYYADFGRLGQLAKAYEKVFVYGWDYSKHRKRFHGSLPRDCHSEQFVVFAQNHDQVGNRMLGDRFSHLLDFASQKLTAAALLLSPYVPMLFMGEEYGETAPFQYFVSHSDPALIEAVRQGRKTEFAAFHSEGDAPDPQALQTFEASKLNWPLKQTGSHRLLWRFYRDLLALRRTDPALVHLDHRSTEATAREPEQILCLRRWNHESEILACFNFNPQPVELHLSLHPSTWHLILDSADTLWGGPGSDAPAHIPITRGGPVTQQSLKLPPRSVVVYSTTAQPQSP